MKFTEQLKFNRVGSASGWPCDPTAWGMRDAPGRCPASLQRARASGAARLTSHTCAPLARRLRLAAAAAAPHTLAWCGGRATRTRPWLFTPTRPARLPQVPEWTEYYVNYSLLKGIIDNIRKGETSAVAPLPGAGDEEEPLLQHGGPRRLGWAAAGLGRMQAGRRCMAAGPPPAVAGDGRGRCTQPAVPSHPPPPPPHPPPHPAGAAEPAEAEQDFIRTLDKELAKCIAFFFRKESELHGGGWRLGAGQWWLGPELQLQGGWEACCGAVGC
jgi:hypothetical protein